MIINPVLAKELRDRVRTWRSPLLITLYIGILGGIGGLFFYTQTYGGIGGPRILRMGIEIFNMLAVMQLLLIAFLTPGMTAGVISGERERQTLPLLLITRLNPFAVVTGKLFSAISYILLLVIVSLPLFSVVFFFGGMSMREFLQAVGIYLATTLTLGSIGMLCSAFFKRTAVAIVVTYGITFFLLVGTYFLVGIIMSLKYRYGWTGPQPPPVPFIIYLNPLVALLSALPMGGNIMPFGGGTASLAGMKPWQIYLLLDAVIVLITTGLTVWLIHPLRAGLKRRS